MNTEKENIYNYTPLPHPIPITEQEWDEGVIPLVCTRTMAYNHEKYIRNCIDGILMQKTTFPVRVIIHDDASTDKTADIIREYENKYPKVIKVVYQKENSYKKPDKYLRRKPVRDLITGHYLALCEGDDYWIDPLKLQKQVDFMEQEDHKDVVLCFHNAKTLNRENQFGNYFAFDKKYAGVIPKEVFVKYGGGGYSTASVMYRKQMIDDIPAYFRLGAPGDFCLLLLAISKGDIGYIDDVMCVYRIMSVGSWTSNVSKGFRIPSNDKTLATLEEFHRHTNNRYRTICKPLLKNIYRKRVKFLCQDERIFKTIWIIATHAKQIGIRYAVGSLKHKLFN